MAKCDINLCGFNGGNSLEVAGVAGTVAFSTTQWRYGGYSLRINVATGGSGYAQLGGVAATGATFSAIGRTGATHYQFYFYCATLPTGNTLIGWVSNSAGTMVLRVYIKSNGEIYLENGSGVTSANSSSAISTGVWYRLNLEVTSNATSTLTVQVDNSTILTSSGVSVTAANVTQDFIQLGTSVSSGAVDFYYDDVTIGTTGPVGPGGVLWMYPDAAGTYPTAGGWAGGTGSTHLECDDQVSDGDTTYIGATATDDNTARTFNIISTSGVGFTYGPVFAAKLYAVCRTASATGTSVVGLRIRSSTTDLDTTGVEWTTSYTGYCLLITTDPNGGGALTRTVLDSLQIGVYAGTLAQAQRCTQLTLMVWQPTPYSITAEQGSFALTGQAATVRPARKVVAAQGSYTLSGQAATILATKKIVAATGSYALNGQTVILRPRIPTYVTHSDTSGEGAVSGTTLTLSVTVSGTNRVLFVWVAVQENSFTNSITGVTYNGTAMTQLEQGVSAEEDTGCRGALFGLVNPATGTNNVVVTFADDTWWAEAVAVVYENVHQIDPWDDTAFSGGTSTGTTEVQTVTVVTEHNNDHVVDFFAARADSLISVNDPTYQASFHDSSLVYAEGSTGVSSRIALAPTPGSYNMSWWAVNTGLHHVHAALALRGVDVLSAFVLTADYGSFTYTGQTASLERGLKLTADNGSYTLSGQAAALLHNYVVAAAHGSYALSGQAASLKRTLDFNADYGSYALSGQAASLEIGYKVVAASGSYTLSGQAASLEIGYKLTAAHGTYTLSGQDATLTYSPITGYTLTADHGTYTLSGQAASLEVGYKVVAAHGAYSLSGQDANLKQTHIFNAEFGSYALSGQPASLERGLLVTAGQGTFTYTGQAASLERGLEVNAEHGSYALSGQAASLEYGHRLAAAHGSYLINGQDVDLIYSGSAKVLNAAYGSYALSGQDASLEHGYRLVADNGSYALAGQVAQLATGRVLAAGEGIYSLSGQAATLLRTATLVASHGAYSLAGQSAGLLRAAILSADAGSYTLSGQDAGLVHELSYTLIAEVGTYVLSGQAATLSESGVLAPSSLTGTLRVGPRITGILRVEPVLQLEPDAIRIGPLLTAEVRIDAQVQAEVRVGPRLTGNMRVSSDG